MSEQSLPIRRRKIAGENRRRRPTATDPTTAQTSMPVEQPSAKARRPPTAGHGPGVPAETAPGVETVPAAASPAVGQIPSWLLGGLAILLVAALAFDVVFAVRSHNSDQQRTTQSAAITSAFNQAPAQAETAATRILAYDYKTLQDDADEAKAYMTPSYAQEYQKTVDGLLAKPANQVKAHVEAEVKGSGVVSATASKVDVMLFIDQTSTTTSQAEPQTYLNRVVLTMVRSGDRWLVDEVTAL